MYTYKDLHFYEWMLNELKKEHPDTDATKIEELIIETKRVLRSKNKKESDGTFIADDWDGYIRKFPLPESITTREDAYEYFREYEYIHYQPTYYDCTGQAFTSWFKIFRKPDGRFWAYHRVSRDV